MNILFLPPPEVSEPLVTHTLAALGAHHRLTLCDYSAPLGPQFEGIDAVIDYGGAMGTREMADLSASVRLWQILGNGYDHFDLDYWRLKRIPVANCPGECSGIALAECAMMFMLMLGRRWNETQISLQNRKLYLPMGLQLKDRSLGLIGFGASGRQLALRASAFRMRVSAVDVRHIPPEDSQRFGLVFAGKPKDIDKLMRESDFISLHLPLDAKTHGIIDERRLGLMKRTAYLINVSRGALVDEAALYRALRADMIEGAALDVFSSEPIDPGDPILHLPNVIATPHISGDTDGTWHSRVTVATENLERVALGLEPKYRIDGAGFQVLSIGHKGRLGPETKEDTEPVAGTPRRHSDS